MKTWIGSEITHTVNTSPLMSGYTNFAVIGAGGIGSFIVQQLLKDKAAGIVKEVVVLSRQVTCHSSVPRDMLSNFDLVRAPRPRLKATPR